MAPRLRSEGGRRITPRWLRKTGPASRRLRRGDRSCHRLCTYEPSDRPSATPTRFESAATGGVQYLSATPRRPPADRRTPAGPEDFADRESCARRCRRPPWARRHSVACVQGFQSSDLQHGLTPADARSDGARAEKCAIIASSWHECARRMPPSPKRSVCCTHFPRRRTSWAVLLKCG